MGLKSKKVKCRICGFSQEIKLKDKDLERWRKKQGPIQEILHYLTAAEREILMSGTCGKCFDELFPPYEE